MYACQQGRDHTVRQILHRKPGSVRERDRTGKTALHYCAENQTLSCIDQVVEADPALLQARDEDGYTPLHLATIAGNKSVLPCQVPSDQGRDVQALDNEKHTVIHWATVCGEVELLDILVEAGANPSTPDIHGAYPLHYAAQMCGPNSEMGNDVRVGLLVLRKLLQHGVDVAVTDHDGRQPLLWAASAEVRPSHVYCPSGSADAILALVNAGASVSAEDKDGLTALHCAASRGHLDCLDCLLSLCGAEVDTLDSNGCTPLFYSVTLGHADCTQLLLNHSAHPDRQDRKGRTPAHCGAAKGQLETLKLLHQKGADLWKRNVKGDLPLHEACQSGRKDLVMWLLSMRPDTVNAPNLDGRCPLHIAAINNNIEMCKILMDQQAAVNPIMRNSRGQLLTPLDAAVARSNRGCAKYLQLHGGVTASKLTDKHALQKAMQRALETSQHGSTGATPTDYAENDLMSSSASSALKSNRSTMTASPINSEAQTDTGDLHQNSKDGGDDKKSDKPEQKDAQTGTSEVSIRKLVLEEEAELAQKEEEEEGEQETKEDQEDVKKEDAEMQNGDDTTNTEASVDADSQSASGQENGENVAAETVDAENAEKKEAAGDESGEVVSKDDAEVGGEAEGEGDEGKEMGAKEDGEVAEEEITKTVRDTTKTSHYAEIPEQLKEGEEQEKNEGDNGDVPEGGDVNLDAENPGEGGKKKKLRKSKKSKQASKKGGDNTQTEVDDGEVDDGEVDDEGAEAKESREQSEISQEDEAEDGEGASSVSKSKRKKGSKAVSRKNSNGEDGGEDEVNGDSGNLPKEETGKPRKRKGKKSKMLKKANTVVVGDGGEGEEMEISQNGEAILRPDDENGEAEFEGDDGTADEDEDDDGDGDGNGDDDDEEEEEEEENMEYSEEERSGDEEMEQTDDEYVVNGEHGKQSSDGAGPKARPKSAAQPGMGKSQGKQNQKGGSNKKSSSTGGSKGKPKTKGKGQKTKSKSKASSDDNNSPGTRRVSISDRPSEDYDPNTTESDVPGKPPLPVGDERTHELMLESSGRDFLMVNDAAPARLSSPSSTHGRDTGDSGFKESGFSDYLGPEQDSDVDGPTDPERHTDDENVQHPTKRKTKTRRLRNKQREERLVGAKGEDGEERPGRRKAGGGRGEDGDDDKPSRRKRDSRNRHTPNSRASDEADEGGGDSEDMGDIDEEDEDALRKLGISTHRRAGVRKGQTRSGAMSGGPRKVETMESSLRRKAKKPTNASTEMSITQAMQTTMRKYALERRLFQQLLDLKRLQIRNTRANEHVLIKRMVDTNMKDGNSLGLRGYSGPFNFQSYEKYLYDQLRFLQSSQGTKIPTFRPSDDVEKLSRAIRRAEILELPDPLMTPRDPYECNHTTHRCHHAAHAYTGIPCAAYLGHRNARKKNFSLPRIAGTTNTNGGGTSLGGSPGPPGGSSAPSRLSEPIGLRNYDPKKPLTVELQHGQARQQITLPTEILDKSKKYHLTFTIKPSSPTKGSQSPEEGNQVVERSASAPETIDADTLPIEPRPEPHSAPPEGRTEPT
ncbi:protein phosphatase 1 regulatory subunit 12A-like [Macrobrachium nipponense]|uniref:protein phosphatase 1 regulatory subunit 12A-like n=1 Tax=Macrobrachium nipponense TaxID=159736 RepID=UPI0030C8B259